MEDHYTYRIMWSEEDHEHVALCVELPSLSCIPAGADTAGSSQEAGVQELVRDIVADMKGNGETPPEPLADRAYSGRFVVRLPPETHRELVLQAAEEGVSLNRLVSARLAR